MMFKQVEIYTDKVDEKIESLQDTMEENHIKYVVHNIDQEPLDRTKLHELLKHFNLEHFILNNGNGSKKLLDNLGEFSRSEVIEKLAENNKLLKKPIIVAGRLTTVGFNWDSLMTMLYLRNEESDDEKDNAKNREN